MHFKPGHRYVLFTRCQLCSLVSYVPGRGKAIRLYQGIILDKILSCDTDLFMCLGNCLTNEVSIEEL
jgi:hypothetical protein